MDKERQYFSEQGEWTHQEREFAERAIRDIGLDGWHALLLIQRHQGNEEFIKATCEIWEDGMPPPLR